MDKQFWMGVSPSRWFRTKPGRFITAALTAATVVFSASTASAQASRPPLPQTITINRDMGGGVYHYAWTVARAAHNGSEVRIRGACVSACTLYLAMPRDQVCITPGARFSFHLPYGASRSANKKAADYMMRKYPQWVRNWIAAKGGLSKNMIHMGSRYASQFIKTCGSASAPVYVSAQPANQAPVAKANPDETRAVVSQASFRNVPQVVAKAEPKRVKARRAAKQKRQFVADR